MTYLFLAVRRRGPALGLALTLALVLAVPSCATTADSVRQADVRALVALHAEALRAHLESDIDLLLAAKADDYVVASGGEVSSPNKEARRAFLGPYLEQTRFSVYRDLVPPVVKVSADGTLGWVVVQIEARGEQTGPDGAVRPIEFVSAWIELYEKRNGRWLRVGNVSNFKPDEGE